MKKIVDRVIVVIMSLLVIGLLICDAEIVSITHDFQILNVGDPNGHLTGILSMGDTVHVEAYYDPELCTRPQLMNGITQAFYSFPRLSGEESFTVNG